MADNENKPHLHVEFFEDKHPNKKKSAEAGRPIYDYVEKARIRWAGDKNQVLTVFAHHPSSMRDPATNERLTYAQQFPDHYKAFKEQREFHGSGTPLSELPFLTEAKRAELRAFNIHTAEAIASLDGSTLQKLGMGARELKNHVEAWLEEAKGGAPIAKLAAENTALQDQVSQMKAEMDRMKAQMASEPQPGPTDAPVVDHSLTGNPPPTEETTTAPDPNYTSPFQSWTDDAIKAWLKDATGSMPRGTPKHDTLVQLADEANAKLAEANAA